MKNGTEETNPVTQVKIYIIYIVYSLKVNIMVNIIILDGGW